MLDFWGVTPWKLTVAAPSPKKQPPSQKRKSLELSKHQFSGALAVSFVIFHALQATQTQKMFRKTLKLQGTNQVTPIFNLLPAKNRQAKNVQLEKSLPSLKLTANAPENGWLEY